MRSGLFSSDDALAAELQAAGERALDPCWRMPLDDEYADGLKSNFADMANVGRAPAARSRRPSSCSVSPSTFPWAHLDIAGTAWKSGATKGATGRPVGSADRVRARARALNRHAGQQVEFHTGLRRPPSASPAGSCARPTCRTRGCSSPRRCRWLDALDRALWTFEPQDFVPHRRVAAGTPDAACARTPIWLCAGGVPPGSPPILVNLGADMPDRPDAFERIIEVLSTDDAEMAAGRERWRRYKAQGLTVQHHQRRGT